MQEIRIPKATLQELYQDKKLSTYSIAKIYGCNPKTIYRKLRVYSIKTRPIIKINLPRKELFRLYHDEKLSLEAVSEKFACSRATVSRKMKEHYISIRDLSEASTKYRKFNFSNNPIEKAYLVGFRLGDLYVFKHHKLICVKSNTTKLEQAMLIRNMFMNYGYTSIKKHGNVYYCAVSLNQTFSFLLPKTDFIENWILDKDELFLSFVAGYTDAEGNVGLYPQPRIRIRTYDKNLLWQIHMKLNDLGIRSKYRLESYAGYRKSKKDCYGVYINIQGDIGNIISMIKPYMKHAKRLIDMNKVIEFQKSLT